MTDAYGRLDNPLYTFFMWRMRLADKGPRDHKSTSSTAMASRHIRDYEASTMTTQNNSPF